MKAVNVEPVSIRADGKQVVRAFVIADNTPESLPTTGNGIEGMTANQLFAPFSLLYVAADATTKVYVANESGVFVAQ